MLRFEVRPVIRHARNTEGGPFLILRFEVRPVIRYGRKTEGGPFFMLRFEVRSVIRYVRNTEGGHIFFLSKKGDWENLKEQNIQTIKEETAPVPPPFLDTLYVRGNFVLHQNVYVNKKMRNSLLLLALLACKVELKACYKWLPNFESGRIRGRFGRNVGK